MSIKKTLAAAAITAALGTPGIANAGIDFLFDWAATGEGPATQSNAVRELKFTAESAIVFNGDPFTAGTTFTDFIVLRVDQLFDSVGDEVIPYGPSVAQQITITAQLSGTQTGALTYNIDGFTSFGLYYDGPNNGFTNASFGGALANFEDGALVETASSVTGTGANSPSAPDGVLDLSAQLLDLLIGADFETDVNGGSLGDPVFAMTNSNNHLCGTPGQTCGSSANAILALFNQAPNDAAIHTKSDGSIEKMTVPEPGTLALAGLAVLGMGALRRKKQ